MSWQRVYQAANSIEAHCLKGLLESEYIAVQLTGEGLAAATGELPTSVLEVSLWVEEQDWSRASALLHDYEQQQVKHDWHCARCHEANSSQFEICWQCGAEREENT
ncbi:hypothetical protein A3K86_08380 [Photobacterium jeanii]|uniref:RanBP2-type domain-containing protein n=1 Tax=Photobacterium jeanii TaxID=858640 RepID=A0A178KJP5_9GAMM|nr:DUF2007 domain-containing protein [Photobacterium jeanii]OAN16944.1 hypothetical protein A3K86_08380 [Photobacterium jeanii]PST88235.1 DUF2007 domain-containing protein [Photobacterium jeanii]